MIVIVMGVCGCGKSSTGKALAELRSWTYIEGDDLHPEANRQKMAAGTPLTDEDRWPWLDSIAAAAGALDREGRSVVVACSALKRSYRDRLRRAGPDVRFIHLFGDRKLILERMNARTDHFMPTGLLDSQFATLEMPTEEERVLTLAINEPVAQIARNAVACL